MFERFTDRARRAVVLAQEEARRFNHGYIGTEHLLLGLLSEGEGLAARALGSVGVTTDIARAELQKRVATGTEPAKGHIPFTPRAKKVLELSLREAIRLRHSYIGTEHVLLGLITEGEGVAAQILMATADGGLDHTGDVVLRTMETGQISIEDKAGLSQRLGQGTGEYRTLEQSVRSDDEVRKRLEAIEARLSTIEELLRGLRGENSGENVT